MAYEELRQALEAIDPKQYATAVRHVINRQAMLPGQETVPEADNMLKSFAEQYPPLFTGVSTANLATVDFGVDDETREAFVAGVSVGLIALTEMIDTAAFKDMLPPSPPE